MPQSIAERQAPPRPADKASLLDELAAGKPWARALLKTFSFNPQSWDWSQPSVSIHHPTATARFHFEHAAAMCFESAVAVASFEIEQLVTESSDLVRRARWIASTLPARREFSGVYWRDAQRRIGLPGATFLNGRQEQTIQKVVRKWRKAPYQPRP